MQSTIFKFIWRYSLPYQIALLALTICSFPILYLSLELPKIIINDAISANQLYAKELGLDIGPEAYLLALCGVFLLSVIINGLFKMRINTFSGVIGERMVRRLRFMLIDRILRFPPKHFHKVSQGVMITTVTAESEQLAGYIGESVALPAFQGGTMITILIFMFMQDPILGFASVALIPMQMYIIPKMQRKINALKRERVKNVRILSEEIGETVDGAIEIRASGTQRYHLARFSQILGVLFNIRLEIFKRKFMMKFVNNFINQLTPIMFYSIGGLLALKGDITVGALVAAISAHKDLTSPWRMLLTHYQAMQDSKLKYEQIIDAFDTDDMFAPVPERDTHPPRLAGTIAMTNVTIVNEMEEPTIRNVMLDIHKGQTIAITADDAGSLRALAYSLSGLSAIQSGTYTIDNHNISQISSRQLTREISYTSPEPIMFNQNVLQNINYALRRSPPEDTPESRDEARKTEIKEAELSGNSTDKFDGYWTDFALANANGWIDMRYNLESHIKVVGVDDQLYELGMQDKFDPDDRPDALNVSFYYIQQLMPMALKQNNVDHLVEHFAIDRFMDTLSVGGNLSYGIAKKGIKFDWDEKTLAEIHELFTNLGLDNLAICAGRNLAKAIATQYFDSDGEGSLPEEFEEFNSEEYRQQILALQLKDNQDIDKHRRKIIYGIFLKINLEKHGHELLSEEDKKIILRARETIIHHDDSYFTQAYEPIRENTINKELPLYENMLYGRIRKSSTWETRQVHDTIKQVFEREGAKSFVYITLGFSGVGVRGANMSTVAKQRVQLLRALAKHPHILIIHESMSSMTMQERRDILTRMRTAFPEMTIIYLDKEVPKNLAFDQTFHIDQQQLIPMTKIA